MNKATIQYEMQFTFNSYNYFGLIYVLLWFTLNYLMDNKKQLREVREKQNKILKIIFEFN